MWNDLVQEHDVEWHFKHMTWNDISSTWCGMTFQAHDGEWHFKHMTWNDISSTRCGMTFQAHDVEWHFTNMMWNDISSTWCGMTFQAHDVELHFKHMMWNYISRTWWGMTFQEHDGEWLISRCCPGICLHTLGKHRTECLPQWPATRPTPKLRAPMTWVQSVTVAQTCSLLPWRFRSYVAPKSWNLFTKLHVTPQKTIGFHVNTE